jgi:hypothetical protein
VNHAIKQEDRAFSACTVMHSQAENAQAHGRAGLPVAIRG